MVSTLVMYVPAIAFAVHAGLRHTQNSIAESLARRFFQARCHILSHFKIPKRVALSAYANKTAKQHDIPLCFFCDGSAWKRGELLDLNVLQKN